LVEAIEGSDELVVGVVRHVELETKAHAVSFEGALPKAFDRKDGIVRFVRSVFAAECDGEGGVALGPLAVDGSAVG
jgi:hypothetical protein